VILFLTGIGIGYSGMQKIVAGNYEELSVPGRLALFAAVVSIVTKEWMFWYTKFHAKRVNCGALMADAWHHRSDSLSSIGSFIGILGARLGFAVSVNILSDILIIDEALSVGDPTFMQKCMDKMQEFRESGRTIFFVSHSLEQIKQFCRNVIWLEYGRMRAFGTVREIVPEYYMFVVSFNEMTKEEKEKYRTERLGYWEKGGL